MKGMVSNLAGICGGMLAMVLGLAPVPFALAQTSGAGDEATTSTPAAESVVTPDVARAPASDTGSSDTGPVPQEAPPADASSPSSTLPSDAVSSAANPPDEAPAADAAPATNVPPAAVPAPDIAVTDSRLLSIQIDASGAETATPATAIPYVVDKSCYSWELHYAPAEGDLTLSEELVLPGPARNWNATPADRTHVNPQGSGAITERHFDAATGTASAGWCVAASDPVGSYRYIIRQGDREVARFDFTVGDLL